VPYFARQAAIALGVRFSLWRHFMMFRNSDGNGWNQQLRVNLASKWKALEIVNGPAEAHSILPNTVRFRNQNGVANGTPRHPT
jgi:hypothetical protein